MRPLLLTLLLLAGLAPVARALDTLTPASGPVREGMFLGYEGGAFQLMNKEQKTDKLLVAATLSLQLDPPREVTVTPRAGKPEPMTLQGFEKGMFIFRRNGVEAPRPLSLVKRIEVPFSVQGNVDDLNAQVIPADAAPAAGDLADTGRTTIVHFHYPKSVASMRQGALVATLARESRGSVTLRKVDIPDWSAPAVAQYDLKSLPQFWFYDASGALVKKLTDRFTDEDIASALRSAQR
jgi:hypothetical protein